MVEGERVVVKEGDIRMSNNNKGVVATYLLLVQAW
jgi:hypothetical protein